MVFPPVVTLEKWRPENVWDLLARMDPDGTWPAPDRTKRISRDDATRMLFGWADGLRNVAADVL